MKNLPKLSLFLAAVAVFLFANLVFTACKKDALLQDVSSEQNLPVLDLKSVVSYENGVLTFRDCEDLKKVYEYLGHPNTPRDILSKTFPGFVSLNAAFESISKIAAERSVQPNEYEGVAYWKGAEDNMNFERTIENPFYAMIFNQEGLIQMGGNWIKHTKDGIFIFPPEYSNANLRQSIKPIQHIDFMVKERAGDCEHVYAFQNGNQWKKVTGNQGANYILSCNNATGICQIILLGNFAIESKNRKRGFLGRWYADNADIVGITGVGSTTNASSYSGIGSGGNNCTATDVGLTGTCNPF